MGYGAPPRARGRRTSSRLRRLASCAWSSLVGSTRPRPGRRPRRRRPGSPARPLPVRGRRPWLAHPAAPPAIQRNTWSCRQGNDSASWRRQHAGQGTAAAGARPAATRTLPHAGLPALRRLARRGAPLDAALRRTLAVGATAGDEPGSPTNRPRRAHLHRPPTGPGKGARLDGSLRQAGGTAHVRSVILGPGAIALPVDR